MKKELGIFILLVVLCVITAIINPRFISPENLQNTSRLIGISGIFSLGLGVVIMTGGIDLSVGSVMAILGVLLSMMLNEQHLASPIAVIIVVGIAMLLGLFHGVLITKVRIQPFIVTLCGLLFYRGLARFVAHDETKGFSNAEGIDNLRFLASGSVVGIPMPLILLIVIAVIMFVVLHRSVYGRYLFAVGRNEEAARYSGINTSKIVISAYVICSGLTGIAAILFAFYSPSISPSSHGQSYELYGIAAAVLGGCSLRGGEGSVIGILIGTALLQVLQNLVNLLGIPDSLNLAVMGAVILLGVIADQIIKQRSARTVKVVI